MNFVEKLAYFGILAAVFAVINLNAQKLFPTNATDSDRKRRAYRLLAFAISLLVVAGGVAAGFSIFR
jgi:hypothetical protein